MRTGFKMSKNRFKIHTWTTYITEESAAIGDFDRTEDGNDYVFKTLTQVADFIVSSADYDGMHCFDYRRFSCFENDFTQDYRTGEEAREGLSIIFGANMDSDLNRHALRIAVCNRLKRNGWDADRVERFLRGY